MKWVFDTLGIDRQADVSTIRKAYARALKQCDQATEVERFQRIRQAYEWAMRQAEHAGSATVVSTAPPATVERKQPPPAAARMLPEDDVHELASQAFAEFMEAAHPSHAAPIGALLTRYARDARLTSLDAKMLFERAVLVHALTAPVNMLLLDEASDQFAWETSNRHLAAVRPDLVHRLQRQQVLRRLLDNGGGADRRQFVDTVELYALCQRNPDEQAMPWQVVDANRLLDRYASFRHELDDRFGAEAFRWWNESLRKNAALLRAYEERQMTVAAPARRSRPQRRTDGNSPFIWIALLPLLGLVHLIGGNFTSPPYHQPVYEAPNVQMSDEPAQLSRKAMDEQFTREMAQQGQPEAQNQLGEKAKLAATDTRDYREAFEWFQKAASRGYPPAEYNLALMYEQGLAVEQDPVKALELIRQAATNGCAEAQFHLGVMYKDGRMGGTDARQARLWWEKAAGQNHLEAQYRLGELYAQGDGVPQDYEAAARWWGPAATSGNADAQSGMGTLSEKGLGVARSDGVAFRWYRNAAAQGNIAALTSLASMYEQGKIAAKSPVIADALLRVAASRTGPLRLGKTAAMTHLEQQLSVQQRQDARLLAGELAGGVGSRTGFVAMLDRASSSGVVSGL